MDMVDVFAPDFESVESMDTMEPIDSLIPKSNTGIKLIVKTL